MDNNYSYSLKIRQEPKKARSSGFSEVTGRSLIGPSLIIELVHDYPPNALEDSQFVCTAVLYDKNMKICQHAIFRDDSRYAEPIPFDTMVGTKTVTGTILHDPVDGISKIFFVFRDLSVRIHGEFRLLIHCKDMTRLISPGAAIFTSPFKVYTPKTFPGVDEPTALSKAFAIQGIPLPGRRYKRISENATVFT